MCPLRPGRCYRHFSGPPYTRLEYIPGAPQVQIPKFDLGNVNGKFEVVVKLVAEENGQIRANALEAARQMAHKYLASKIGEQNYHLRLVTYPHHVLRENKMLAMAGADRLQEGMRLAFGTPVGRAARVYRGSVVMYVRTRKEYIDHAKEALRRASSKISIPCRIVVEELSEPRGPEGIVGFVKVGS
ncbi:MAG: 50S ribosomal protein L16 [Thermoprotei archaeon]|nr:MAG: 50S ribosomal protein L16 [Thermoprotei archaeon]